MTSSSRLRVGVVSYLNMLPLTYGMETLGDERSSIEVVSVPPAPMAELMDRGELDMGMLPVGAVMDRPDWDIVGHSMIGSNGPVKSVLALGAGNPSRWKRLNPDSHSRTSNLLVQVLLNSQFNTRLDLNPPVPMTGWAPPDPLPEGEGFVLIGTRALQWRHLAEREGVTVLDLGERWTAWTGLPFVFAVWAARRDLDLGDWLERFEKLKHRNRARLAEIVREWPGLKDEGLSVEDAVRYLTENIKFDLDERALAGLARFHQEGRRLGFFEAGWDPEKVLRAD